MGYGVADLERESPREMRRATSGRSPRRSTGGRTFAGMEGAHDEEIASSTINRHLAAHPRGFHRNGGGRQGMRSASPSTTRRSRSARCAR